MKGHVSQRKNGSWFYQFDIGRDADGKRLVKREGKFKTKTEAQRAKNKAIYEWNTGTFIEPANISVAEYLRRWLADYAKHNVATTTYEGYELIVEKHLIPNLGNLLLPKLQPIQIQSYISHALESGRSRGNGGLSEKTVVNHIRVLKEALQHAVGWQLLSYNPALAVKTPRPKQKEIETLNNEEFFIFLEAAREHRYYIPFHLAAMTGMRRGEVLGLRWKDVNFADKKLAVRQAVGITHAGLVFKPPKTKKSKRVISLSPSTVDTLHDHRKMQAEDKLAIGVAYEDHDLVCAHPDGQLIHPRSLSEGFTNLVKKKGLTKVSFHALRHTHATQCLQRGLHIKVVSERLGHSSVQITLDTYSHVMPDLQEEAALDLEDFYQDGFDNYQKMIVVPEAQSLIELKKK